MGTNLFLFLSFAVWTASCFEVRLSGGGGSFEGNVEVYIKGQWKYICDDHWDIRDAKVICRQLKFTKAIAAKHKTTFQLGANVSYWLDDVQCTGSEANVDLCWHRKVGVHNCKPSKELAGVVCSDVEENEKIVPVPSSSSGDEGVGMKLRLNGKSKDGFISSGYLEVLHNGVWGAVCSDQWTRNESFVACGNLGYSNIETDDVAPHQLLAERNQTYWMKEVRCHGSESTLYECEHAGYAEHQCGSNEPVYLTCKRSKYLRGNRFDKSAVASNVIRLRAGSRHSEGRVEVVKDGRWGSICDDGWNIKNANVACRQLGFGTAFEATHHALFGQGSGKVWLDQVNCTGFEKDVRKCQHLGWSVGDCGHAEDAGVKCHFPYGEEGLQVRVADGPHKRIGRVEVFYENKWHGVCGIKWGVREAEVLCRQAGLGYAKRGFSSSKYGLNRDFAMYDVQCSGDELSIEHCFHKKPPEGGCRYYDMAVVECSEFAPDLVMDYREMKKSIRLESVPLYQLSCAHEEGCLTSSADYEIHFPYRFDRTLLKFTSRFWNRGTAAFLPDIKKSDWQWHSCHQHYHSMERFSDYDLTDAHNIKRAVGHKASFCLEDSKCEKGVSKVYNCSNRGDQGVSVGCADNYKWNIDCQWIDVSGLQYGRYTLRVVINPERKVVESDYSNNIVLCDLNFKNQDEVEVYDCKPATCEQMSHGGTGDGACCKFPFTFRKKQYHQCTTDGLSDGSLWCGTTSDYDTDQLWGLC